MFRPGGPDFYINLGSNLLSHGPGGQGPEADPCWAYVIKGQDTVDQIHKDMGNEFRPNEEHVKFARVYLERN